MEEAAISRRDDGGRLTGLRDNHIFEYNKELAEKYEMWEVMVFFRSFNE